MSNEVKVPYGESASDTATLLLAAVEEKGVEPGVVRTTSDGYFIVPSDIAKAAGVDVLEDEDYDGDPDYDYLTKQEDDNERLLQAEASTRAAMIANAQAAQEAADAISAENAEAEKKAPAKKVVAKKATAKKTAAKKTTAKKAG